MNVRRNSDSPQLRPVLCHAFPAVIGLAVALSQVGCAPAVPENPTWTEDVRSIVMANCSRCHTDPPIGGAPNYLRLDRFENWPLAEGGFLIGAGGLADRIADRAADEERPMPPVIGPLSDRQQEILQLWFDNGAPRGEPLADNAAPTVEVSAPVVDTAARTATFEYTITDDEGDYVVGHVQGVSPVDGSDVVVTTTMYRGTGQFVWDFTELEGGNYPLTAVVDDGNTLVTMDVGSVDVPALPVPEIPQPASHDHHF